MALYPAELRVPHPRSYPRSGPKGQPVKQVGAYPPENGLRHATVRLLLLPPRFRDDFRVPIRKLPGLLNDCVYSRKLAHPTGFEPVASAFGGQPPSHLG